MSIATRTVSRKPAGKKVKKAKAVAPPKRLPKALDPLADVDAPDRSTHNDLEIDAEVLEFIAAIERFKKANARPFPNWSEVLQILRELGYRRA